MNHERELQIGFITLSGGCKTTDLEYYVLTIPDGGGLGQL